MTTLYAGTKPLVLKEKHDPDEAIYYSVGWRPAEWITTKEYLLDELVVPTTPNGFYYVCINPGVSGALEPTWGTTSGAQVTDGTAKWQAKPYDLLLRATDTMSSSWVAEDGATVDNPGSNGNINWVRVTAVPADATSFALTNRVNVTRADGKQEIFDRKIIVPILR